MGWAPFVIAPVVRIASCLFLLALSVSVSMSQADGEERPITSGSPDSWQQRITKIEALHQQGHYVEEGQAAQEALEAAKKTFGPQHPSVARFLHDLAVAYQSQSKLAAAEPLYQESIAIYEKNGPAYHGNLHG